MFWISHFLSLLSRLREYLYYGLKYVNTLLLKEPVGISEAQLNQFRDLFDVLEDSLAIDSESDNFRPMQPLNGRDLLFVFAASTNQTATAILIFLNFLALLIVRRFPINWIVNGTYLCLILYENKTSGGELLEIWLLYKF